jgi:hypothetical protein
MYILTIYVPYTFAIKQYYFMVNIKKRKHVSQKA